MDLHQSHVIFPILIINLKFKNMKKFTVTMKTLSVQQKEIFAENETEALEIANSEDWREKEEILSVHFETDSPLDFIELK